MFAQVVPSPDLVWKLLDNSPLIAMIVAFIVGWLVPRWAYTELKERCAKFEKLSEEMAALAKLNVTAAEELRQELKFWKERSGSGSK